jgi:hypothetical protein
MVRNNGFEDFGAQVCEAGCVTVVVIEWRVRVAQAGVGEDVEHEVDIVINLGDGRGRHLAGFPVGYLWRERDKKGE